MSQKNKPPIADEEKSVFSKTYGNLLLEEHFLTILRRQAQAVDREQMLSPLPTRQDAKLAAEIVTALKLGSTQAQSEAFTVLLKQAHAMHESVKKLPEEKQKEKIEKMKVNVVNRYKNIQRGHETKWRFSPREGIIDDK